MATSLKKDDVYGVPGADMSGYRVAVAVSEWHPEIMEALYTGAESMLLSHGLKKKNLFRMNVPGSFELSSAAQIAAKKSKIDAVICLGCVIKGETQHFDFICNAVAHGITNVSLSYEKPVIFGVLTPNTLEQAQDRAGGKYGNKGEEAAIAAIKMLILKKAK